jgi:hypothetical protein
VKKMGDWTKEAQKAISLCMEWGRELTDTFECKAYLFGSAIYKDGIQFDRVRSDLDIICLLPDTLRTAEERWEFIRELQGRKLTLELDMIPRLGRTVCDEPGVSLVPITSLELKANIHKSGARRFFDKNSYLNLATGEMELGLPEAGSLSVTDELRQAVEYVQRIRNDYLGLAANDMGGLRPYRGHDPLPKGLMRSAAQLAANVDVGEWYDTRVGLELLHKLLSERRVESPVMKELFDEKLSVLRGGRGPSSVELSADDQLLLAEILFDECAAIAPSRTIDWEIHTNGGKMTDEAVSFRISRIRQLVPNAIRTGGSGDVLRFRSGEADVELLTELAHTPALEQLLRVERARVAIGQTTPHERDVSHGLDEEERFNRVALRLSGWRPTSPQLPPRAAEYELSAALEELVDDPAIRLMGYIVEAQARLDGHSESMTFDFLLRWEDGIVFPIELHRFQTMGKLTEFMLGFAEVSRPMLLMVYDIPPTQMARAVHVENSLSHINSNVRVLRIERVEADADIR